VKEEDKEEFLSSIEDDTDGGKNPYEMVFKVNLVTADSPASSNKRSCHQSKRKKRNSRTKENPEKPKQEMQDVVTEDQDNQGNHSCETEEEDENIFLCDPAAEQRADAGMETDVYRAVTNEAAALPVIENAFFQPGSWLQGVVPNNGASPAFTFGSPAITTSAIASLDNASFHDSNGAASPLPGSPGFMFLKTEPMALAQEERLARNPYFIRTPPQLRRTHTCGGLVIGAPTFMLDDNMEDDEILGW